MAKIMILGKLEKMVNLAKMANLEQMAKNHQAPWRVAILAKMEKFFQRAGDSTWMAKVAARRLAILEKMAKFDKNGESGPNSEKSPKSWRYPEYGKYSNWIPSGPLKLHN